MKGLLEDRVVLVTGAGGGIGRGVAVAVAEAGGHVVATDLGLDLAAETAARVEQAGRRSLPLALDVTEEASVEAAVDRTLEDFGRLDGLVNNAGILTMGPALDASVEDWHREFEVNVFGVALCCRVAGRRMIEAGPGGAIVNVASNTGKVGYPNMAAYNASKAAVINLTRSLSAEWAEHDLNVNAVCPGGVDTPMLGQAAEWIGARIGEDPATLLDTMVPQQLGRHVRPEEVGRVVAFLLSGHARIIRGQSINVDGGEAPY